MLTEYVSDEQWKKEAVYEVGDVVYNTRTVSGNKGIYSAGSKFRICDIQASTSTRKQYNGKTPYQLFCLYHGKEMADLLEIREVPADKVIQSKRLLKLLNITG